MADFMYLGPEPELYVGNIYEYHVSKLAVGYWMCISAAAEGNFLQFIGITDLVRVPESKLKGTMQYQYGPLVNDDGEVVVDDISFYLAEDNYCTYQDILFNGSLPDDQPKYGVKLIKSAAERDVSGLCDIIDANAYFKKIQIHCEENVHRDDDGTEYVTPVCGMAWWKIDPRTNKPVYPYYCWLKPKEKDPITGGSKWPIGYRIESSSVAIVQNDMDIPNRCFYFLKPWAFVILNRALANSMALRLPNLADMVIRWQDFKKSVNETSRDRSTLNLWQMTKQETPIAEEFFDEFDPEEENRRANRLGTGMFLPKSGL